MDRSWEKLEQENIIKIHSIKFLIMKILKLNLFKKHEIGGSLGNWSKGEWVWICSVYVVYMYKLFKKKK